MIANLNFLEHCLRILKQLWAEIERNVFSYTSERLF